MAVRRSASANQGFAFRAPARYSLAMLVNATFDIKE
jgi:hypothetical protein